jgi:sigma-B regulation protein RsbU (phosphoserine phosphatase)
VLTPGIIVLTALLAGVSLVCLIQRLLISRLTREREEIRTEESRVFDFLHGLGEAFSADVRPADLHRLIVEGTMRIVEAEHGALYLLDRSGTILVPAFISSGVAPFVAVPAHVLKQGKTAPVALDSYLRLHSVPLGDGLIGGVMQRGEILSGDGDRPAPLEFLSGNGEFTPGCLMIAPLMYARQKLGVLAISNSRGGALFQPSDAQVFSSIAEQSAFALYNAIVFSDASEKKRLDHDLDVARDIQRILLPSSAPEIPGYQIAGINVPARQVSGDYLDYLKLADEKMGIVIADVSGKGVPASLIMAMCRSALRSEASGCDSAAYVLRKVNRLLFPDIKEDMFVSMAYGILDPASNELVLARAGHDAPLKFDAATGKISKINPPGMAIGIDSGDVFDRVVSDVTIAMEPGDCLIFYTDGITEALDRNGAEFGLDRLMRAVQSSAPQGAAAIIRRLTHDVGEFSGNLPQHDDITLIAIRRDESEG